MQASKRKCPVCGYNLMHEHKFLFCPNISCVWVWGRSVNRETDLYNKSYKSEDLDVLMEEMNSSLGMNIKIKDTI
jgi:hypothetical protein